MDKCWNSIAAICSLCMVTLVAVAQNAPPKSEDGPGGPGGQTHRKPPEEAFAACKTLSAGATCQFTSPRGPETGSCFAPEGKPLACRPQHGDKPAK